MGWLVYCACQIRIPRNQQCESGNSRVQRFPLPSSSSSRYLSPSLPFPISPLSLTTIHILAPSPNTDSEINCSLHPRTNHRVTPTSVGSSIAYLSSSASFRSSSDSANDRISFHKIRCSASETLKGYIIVQQFSACIRPLAFSFGTTSSQDGSMHVRRGTAPGFARIQEVESARSSDQGR